MFMLYILTVLSAVFLLTTNVHAEGMTFGIAGKRLDDINFITVWQGCQLEAEKFGDTCVHVGEKGPAHFRQQDKAISQALEKGVDGIAVSVLNSEWLSKHSLNIAVEKNIPIITFDSDLDKKHKHIRHAYIGMDNLEVGREAGRVAKELKPEGGTVWLMSGGPHSTNLNQRLRGVRQALSGNLQFPEGEKISGEGGWKEHTRSPWYNDDNYERSLEQIKLSLGDSRFDVFISLGHWPIMNPKAYRDIMTTKKSDYSGDNQKIFIIAVGELLPKQKKILDDRLIHAYIVVDFTEMGRGAYHLMKKIASGQKVPEKTYTGIRRNLWNDKLE